MNRCHLLGKLLDDPELEESHGSDVLNFRLEVEEYRKDKGGGKKRRTDVLNFEVWDSAARTIHEYARSNDLMSVEAIARNLIGGGPHEVVFRVTNFKIIPRDDF
jgi:single-stranded DNA-binding protein